MDSKLCTVRVSFVNTSFLYDFYNHFLLYSISLCIYPFCILYSSIATIVPDKINRIINEMYKMESHECHMSHFLLLYLAIMG